MVLNNRRFDDLEDFCEFDEQLDPSTHQDDPIDGGNAGHALSWRKTIIEKAVSNVKRAVENRADVRSSYKKGVLLFDEQAKKFGRVMESKPGFLTLSLVTGGELVRQDINHLDFVRENRNKMTLLEMAQKLCISEAQIVILVNQLDLLSDPAPVKVAKKPLAAITKKASGIKKHKLKGTLTKDTVPTAKRSATNLATKKKLPNKKKSAYAGSDSNMSFAKFLPKGATTDPVMDPNGYIQQNFLMMSNRELALATGLSEHTIRRKLGEWNLKRKEYTSGNKA